MKIRRLEEKDAILMLEWMHDESVVKNMHTDFSSKTAVDCISFIKSSHNEDNRIDMAITSDDDEYMGTVSLKHINEENGGLAEFAIVIRSIAMGKGYAWFGMQSMFDYGFNKLGIKSIYWCVSKDNKRAIRFYDKHNFHENLNIDERIINQYDGKNLKCYSALRGDVLDDREYVVGCKVVHNRTLSTIDAGELSFLEGNRDIPFDIKRIYFITKAPLDTQRGFHAHKKLKQLLFCPYGKIKLTLENELGREEIELSDPSVGILIDRLTWREMLWLQEDSVLCVAASEYYKADDYVRNYQDFKKMIDDKREKF